MNDDLARERWQMIVEFESPYERVKLAGVAPPIIESELSADDRLHLVAAAVDFVGDAAWFDVSKYESTAVVPRGSVYVKGSRRDIMSETMPCGSWFQQLNDGARIASFVSGEFEAR